MNFDKAIDTLKDSIFNKIHSSTLVYNTCWEDPAIDRELLLFDNKSKIVMITSAGCNTLDYLLDDVKEIHCVDVNPRQNALLNLKKSIFLSSRADVLKSMFQKGKYKLFQETLDNELSKFLTKEEKNYWKKKAYYFTGEKSFYYRGSSGKFAWLFSKYLDAYPKARKVVNNLLSSTNESSQKLNYAELEGKIFSKLVTWAMNRHITMSLLGVPRSQRTMMQEKFPGGMSEYLKYSIGHVLRDLPIQNNYFWRVYITGKYSSTCKPNYLRESNFDILKKRVNRISTYTTYLSDFLKNNPSKYTHFILLDHQDWLASYNKQALEEEWRLILENSEKGTKILMRSAMLKIDFLPDFVLEKTAEITKPTLELHRNDRVGTYAGIRLMEVI